MNKEKSVEKNKKSSILLTVSLAILLILSIIGLIVIAKNDPDVIKTIVGPDPILIADFE